MKDANKGVREVLFLKIKYRVSYSHVKVNNPLPNLIFNDIPSFANVGGITVDVGPIRVKNGKFIDSEPSVRSNKSGASLGPTVFSFGIPTPGERASMCSGPVQIFPPGSRCTREGPAASVPLSRRLSLTVGTLILFVEEGGGGEAKQTVHHRRHQVLPPLCYALQLKWDCLVQSLGDEEALQIYLQKKLQLRFSHSITLPWP